jgi:XisI protein
MDNLEFYRQTIETVLRKYAELPSSYEEIEQYLIIDRERNHFMLFDLGWQQKRPWMYHSCPNYR